MLRFLKAQELKMYKGEAVGSTCEHSDNSEVTVNDPWGGPSNNWHNRYSVNIYKARRDYSSTDNMEERDEILEF